MNNPIISPWIIYLIDMCDGVNLLLSRIIIVTFFGLGVVLVWRCLMVDDISEDDNKRFYRIVKSGIAIIIAVSVTQTLMPTKETAYKMLVSTYVTEENIEKATDAIKSGVDYIFEKLDGGVSDD